MYISLTGKMQVLICEFLLYLQLVLSRVIKIMPLLLKKTPSHICMVPLWPLLVNQVIYLLFLKMFTNFVIKGLGFCFFWENIFPSFFRKVIIFINPPFHPIPIMVCSILFEKPNCIKIIFLFKVRIQTF